jgi:hypothetical protein
MVTPAMPAPALSTGGTCTATRPVRAGGKGEASPESAPAHHGGSFPAGAKARSSQRPSVRTARRVYTTVSRALTWRTARVRAIGDAIASSSGGGTEPRVDRSSRGAHALNAAHHLSHAAVCRLALELRPGRPPTARRRIRARVLACLSCRSSLRRRSSPRPRHAARAGGGRSRPGRLIVWGDPTIPALRDLCQRRRRYCRGTAGGGADGGDRRRAAC